VDYTESIVETKLYRRVPKSIVGGKGGATKVWDHVSARLTKGAGMIGDNGCKNDAGPYNASPSRVDIALGRR
jgi:hypothetical protein